MRKCFCGSELFQILTKHSNTVEGQRDVEAVLGLDRAVLEEKVISLRKRFPPWAPGKDQPPRSLSQLEEEEEELGEDLKAD